jgi:hypothetical protein
MVPGSAKVNSSAAPRFVEAPLPTTRTDSGFDVAHGVMLHDGFTEASVSMVTTSNSK